jgi:hypothetical protein
MLAFIAGITLIILCKYVRPLLLVKYRAIIFLGLLPFVSFAIGFTDNIYVFGVLQGLAVIFSLGQLPAAPILFQHFPIFKRFMIKVVKDPMLAQYRPEPFEKLDRRVVKKEFDCSNGSYALPDSLQVSDAELDSMNALLNDNATASDSTGSPQ